MTSALKMMSLKFVSSFKDGETLRPISRQRETMRRQMCTRPRQDIIGREGQTNKEFVLNNRSKCGFDKVVARAVITLFYKIYSL